MALVVLALLAGTVAFAQKNSQKSLESQRAKLQKDIELINRKLAENSRSSEKVLSNLTLVRSKIAKREQLIDECDRTLSCHLRKGDCRPSGQVRHSFRLLCKACPECL